MNNYIRFFDDIRIRDVPEVGGKNASLGEMFHNLSAKGVQVPDGFAVTADAYWHVIDSNHLRDKLTALFDKLDTENFSNLRQTGSEARALVSQAELPTDLSAAIKQAYQQLESRYGSQITLAIRSSATAEDLPDASFAGQQDSFLNISGPAELLATCVKCYASLFTDRAIKYRFDNHFAQMKVALSIGVQVMVRSDKASSGVIFTLDPDSGFRNAVIISGAWGLGENVVQGSVNVDEYCVFKPSLENGAPQPVLYRRLGSKDKTMVYATGENGATTLNVDTPPEKRASFILSDAEVTTLARWAVIIEQYYQRPMDIEWAKDGLTGGLYMVQARPETVFSKKTAQTEMITYRLKEKGEALCSGLGLGDKIVSGKARILHAPSESDLLQEGEILVTERTNPDWDPILKKAAGIVTEKGGRTSHAAIIAREVGAVAVVGTGNATHRIKDGEPITIVCSGGQTGIVYRGHLQWEEKKVDLSGLKKTKTKAMLILGDPDYAFRQAALPNDGVGLMRLEFIINNAIGIHPMALKHFEALKDPEARAAIEARTRSYPDKESYFVQKLSEAVATIAAAFYPKPVIVRMSDFKTNEYAHLIGGQQFEPKEENPMLGWRGASRYYHPAYREGFELECRAMKTVREQMQLTNVKLMVPFCRTVPEAKKVIAVMAANGLQRGRDGLEIYMMAEIPSNIILAEAFAEHFDGFSIGSNDLTQLTLGVDRDSEILSGLFDAHDPAVKQMISHLIKAAHEKQVPAGLCGQIASDSPEYARFLVAQGIDSISFNADALLKGIRNIMEAEASHP